MLRDGTVVALQKALEGNLARQQAAAGNLANAETPGYQAVRVSFEQALTRALQAPEQRRVGALERVRPEVGLSGEQPLRRDGNNVDLEAEMITLGETSLQHQVLLRLLQQKLQMIRQAINGGPGR